MSTNPDTVISRGTKITLAAAAPFLGVMLWVITAVNNLQAGVNAASSEARQYNEIMKILVAHNTEAIKKNTDVISMVLGDYQGIVARVTALENE